MGVTSETAEAVLERAGGRCEWCWNRLPTQLHHVEPKGMGGVHGEAAEASNREENLKALCVVCHAAAHGETHIVNGFRCSLCARLRYCAAGARLEPVVYASLRPVRLDRPLAGLVPHHRGDRAG